MRGFACAAGRRLAWSVRPHSVSSQQVFLPSFNVGVGCVPRRAIAGANHPAAALSWPGPLPQRAHCTVAPPAAAQHFSACVFGPRRPASSIVAIARNFGWRYGAGHALRSATSVCAGVWPNPSLNADVPHAGLRPRNRPPVSLIR